MVRLALGQNALPRYLSYWTETSGYWNQVHSQVIQSTIQNFSASRFENLRCPLPPLDEQAAIVKYLTHVDRKIDRFIRAKRKLITLLEEQKQAIIHQAVTKGLDPDVPMKDSGVEWLGEIPAHWEVKKDTGRVAELTTGFPFKSEGFSQSESDIRLLRGVNVSTGRVRWDAVVRWPKTQLRGLENYQLLVGDIVLGMDRPFISHGTRVAKVAEDDVPALLLQRVCRIRASSLMDQDFLLSQFQGRRFSDHLAPIFTGISVPHVSPDQINSFLVTVPPRQEQVRIVSSIRVQTLELETATAIAQLGFPILSTNSDGWGADWNRVRGMGWKRIATRRKLETNDHNSHRKNCMRVTHRGYHCIGDAIALEVIAIGDQFRA